MVDLKSLWSAIFHCECGGMTCDDCHDRFVEMGAALNRACPVCDGPCEVRIECPQHE